MKQLGLMAALTISMFAAACGGSGTDPVLSCTDHPSLCGENASCAGTTCVCNDGFAGDGQTCADVDECADGTSGCTAGCTNTEGGFTCAAPVFATVAASGHSACGVMTDNSLWCWGTAFGEASPAAYGTASQAANSVAVSDDHVCKIDPDGVLACAPHVTDDALPTFARVGAGTYLAVSAAGDRTCAIGIDHALACWTGTAAPARVGSATWNQIAVSPVHACGIQSDGTLWCWGDNSNNQLGTHDAASTAPVLTDSRTDWTAIATGPTVSCGIRGSGAAGTALCWGGTALATGGPSTADTGWPTPTVITLTQVAHIGVGATVGCAVSDDGVYCWGDDDHAQLGTGGPYVHRNGPQQNFTGAGALSVAAGDEFGCAVDAGGTLRCWGSDAGYALGNDQIPGTFGVLEPIAASVNGWTNLAMLDGSTCAIHNSAGELDCWGAHGNGADEPRRYQEPTAVDGPTTWRAIGVLLGGACGAHAADGSLWCWDEKTTLHQLGAVSGFTAIGSGLADTHACGLVGGDLYCWGKNTHGELGIGSVDDPSSVTKHNPTRIGADDDWTAVVPHALPAPHTCGLRGGALYCWGEGYGSSPTKIGGDADWTYLEPTSTDAGLRGGTEYAWTAATAPAQTASALTTWKIKIGGAGIGTDGSLYFDDGTAVSATTETFTSLGVQGTGAALELCATSTAGGLWCYGAADTGLDGELGSATAWQATPQQIVMGVPLGI